MLKLTSRLCLALWVVALLVHVQAARADVTTDNLTLNYWRVGIQLPIAEGSASHASYVPYQPVVAWHEPGTGWPWSGIRTVLYAHDQPGYFANINYAALGDLITVTRSDGTRMDYHVSWYGTVAADNQAYLQAIHQDQLVLVTCTSWSASDPRFVVVADGTDGRPWTGASDAVGDPAPAADAYLAEGYTGANFSTYLTVTNTTATADTLQVDYLMEDSAITRLYQLPGSGRVTIYVNDEVGPDHSVAMHLHTRNRTPIVAERPMYFYYRSLWRGGHDDVALAAPRNDAYFAEGYTGGGFDEYLTVANPDPVNTATVDVAYGFEPGVGGFTQRIWVAPLRRATVGVRDVVGSGHEVSMHVHSDVPVIAERPMYFNFFGLTGGHVSSGAASPQTDLDLAEGFVAPSFSEYITLYDPDPNRSATATVTFLLPGGGAVNAPSIAIPAGHRVTLNAASVLPSGTSNSIHVHSDAPIVVERPMYMQINGWYGGHDAVAVASASLQSVYYFAEGFASNAFLEFVTIENGGAAQPAQIELYPATPAQGYCPATPIALNLPAQSRTTVRINDYVPPGSACSMRVRAAAPILVERPMYFAF